MAPQRLLLDGLVALVTGAASGYGEGIAKLFAEEGAKVVVLDVNDEGHRVVTDIKMAGHSAISIKMDVTKAADWKLAVDSAVAQFGRIDVLVNNAGWTYRQKDSLEVSEAEYDRVFDVNVKSIFLSVNAVLPLFLAQGSGSIINISSTITRKTTGGLVYYGATKGAVDMITRGLAREYSHRGVRVNSVAPALGNTGLITKFWGGEFTSEMAQKRAEEVPMDRLCQPMDIGKACVYLAAPYFNNYQTFVSLSNGHAASFLADKLVPGALFFARTEGNIADSTGMEFLE